jgi:hypothetical protein
MLDVFFIKKVIYLCVLELGAIVTSNLLDLCIKLILSHYQELLVFHFYLAKEHSRETGIIINNDKTIFVTINAYVGDRTKQVHV